MFSQKQTHHERSVQMFNANLTKQRYTIAIRLFC